MFKQEDLWQLSKTTKKSKRRSSLSFRRSTNRAGELIKQDVLDENIIKIASIRLIDKLVAECPVLAIGLVDLQMLVGFVQANMVTGMAIASSIADGTINSNREPLTV